MRLELAISLRYLRSRRSDGAISFVTWVALLGVVLGVAALVVAMAVMNGYQTNLIRAMAGSLPHFSINPLRASGISGEAELIAEVRRRFQPDSISPFVMHETLLKAAVGTSGAIRGVVLRGQDTEQQSRMAAFLPFVDDGSPDWKSLPQDERLARSAALLRGLAQDLDGAPVPVLLSRLLAGKLGVKLGDRLTLMKFPEQKAGFSPQPVAQPLAVAGFFESGLTVVDELLVLTHFRHMPALLAGKEVPHSLGVRLGDPLMSGQAVRDLRTLEREAGYGFYVTSWLESNKGIFQVIRLQKVMLFLVLMLIVVIAFFGMLSALTMLVADKTKDIAVLKSLGLREGAIRSIFFCQGMFIGLAGTLLGVGMGLLIAVGLDTFPLIEIPPGVYPGSDRVPVQVAWQDVLLVMGGTMAVCLVATIFPARKAAALTPVDGLRFG